MEEMDVSYSQYRVADISSSDDDSNEFIDASSVMVESSINETNLNEEASEEEIAETDSESDEIIAGYKKKVNRISSSSDDEEQPRVKNINEKNRKTVYSEEDSEVSSNAEFDESNEQESISEKKTESTEKESFTDLDSNSSLEKNSNSKHESNSDNDNDEIFEQSSSTHKTNESLQHKSNTSKNREIITSKLLNLSTPNMESREISKFSKIFDSKSTIDHFVDQNKTENGSLCFNSSIAKKLSSTISNSTQRVANNTPTCAVNSSNKSVEIFENNEVIEIDSSDEIDSLIITTPDLISNPLNRDKKLVQPKISSAISSTPTSSLPKTSKLQPQFVSKEYLYGEVRKLDNMKKELATCMHVLKANVNLPDGGLKMRKRIEQYNIDIKKHAVFVSNLVVDEEEIKANRSAGIDKSSNDPSCNSSNSSQHSQIKAPTWDELAAAVNALQPKYTGTQGLATFAAQKAITVDRLKDIHGSLETCPNESILAENPKELNIELMNHQKHALAWMQWREKQKPRGGILADDMGLGKTLTMIALILAQRNNGNSQNQEDSNDEDNSSQEWLSKGRKDYYNGGTLIVCPASVLGQWEKEITNRCKRNTLQVIIHHGNNRDTHARMLAKNDIVITTYHLIAREFKNQGTLFRVKWERAILDEAHVIRNHKAQMSISVCALNARCRWTLTGTPVQNKEMDLYAIIKFLKCSPFDELGHWKKWIDNKSAGGQARLNTLMKSLLLRRTKAQLQETDINFKLPVKTTKYVEVILEKEEMNVYQKVMSYSRTLFAQFLHQRADKENVLNSGNEAFYKMHKQMVKLAGHDTQIKSFQILVLLLRLRQICCHPSLIHAMLEEGDLNESEDSEELKDIDLLQQLENLQIDENIQNSTDNCEASNDTPVIKAAARVLRKNNPVFDADRASSKLNKILEILDENLNDNNDKAIVVSQWTSLLDLLKLHLSKKGYRTISLNGTIPVKNRNEIVTQFNDEKNKTRIMLLSLTAGGVGLNLVGANHLLLIDLHWNPQLESQAQDRIYRVGQKKPVYVYKFMVKDTVEERIKHLQDKKLEIANNVITGAKSQSSKLTIEDLKGLFGL